MQPTKTINKKTNTIKNHPEGNPENIHRIIRKNESGKIIPENNPGKNG